MRKTAIILLGIVLVSFMVNGNNTEAAFFMPFNSSGHVDPNYNGLWNESTLTGTALYSFHIETPDVPVNAVWIQFEPDIFNTGAIDANDFDVLNASDWSTQTINIPSISSIDPYTWSISYGNTAADTSNDSIQISFEYQLLGADMFSSDSGIGWSWDEGGHWEQSYLMIGKDTDGIYRLSPGSTNPTPEPATMILLGTGLIGLAGLGRKKFMRK